MFHGTGGKCTWAKAQARTRWGLTTVSGLVLAAGCAELLGPPPTAGGRGGQARPDDAQPVALVPAGVTTVIDVNMAALRASAWTAPALTAADARARAAKIDALGYDDVADVDHIIYAVTAAGADAPTLVIAQGRFDTARVQAAFRARWPAATLDRWREAAVLTSGENALGFVTDRTFVSASPAAVRAVIDRSFGIGTAGAVDGALGPVRRALLPEVAGTAPLPAVLATVAIDDQMRARIGDTGPVPRELRQVGIRADVGQSLDLVALGVLDDHAAAALLARRLSELLTSPMIRLGARAMSLRPLLESARITVDGARVRVRASAPDDSRADVAAALQNLMSMLRGSSGASGPGSW